MNEKRIVAFKSVGGHYFSMKRTPDGYCLKNKNTVIPNEFRMYSMEEVKKLFEGLCKCIPQCNEEAPSFPHNNAFWVTYDDGTTHNYVERSDSNLTVCAFQYNTSIYSEFQDGIFHSELITLDHLRRVCQTKEEDFDYLLKILIDFYEDDYVEIHYKVLEDGLIEISKEVYCTLHDPSVTIFSNGSIGRTDKIKYLEAMKQNDVRIINRPLSGENFTPIDPRISFN